ncbi:MAG: glycoside hydrolase family 19 protein [Pyrinomonadaceae bacterium]
MSFSVNKLAQSSTNCAARLADAEADSAPANQSETKAQNGAALNLIADQLRQSEAHQPEKSLPPVAAAEHTRPPRRQQQAAAVLTAQKDEVNFGRELKPASSAAVIPISVQQLLQIQPALESGGRVTQITADLNRATSEAKITTARAQAMFIAQILHEIGAGGDLHENGGQKNYRGQVYDYFFYMYDKGSPDPARRRAAQMIGNTEHGDGAKFHGRGYIQLTGRSNYQRAGEFLHLDLVNDPDLAAEPSHAARIAGWFWRYGNKNLNSIATKDANFAIVTRRINGGLRGIEDRRSLYARAKRALNVE